MLKKILLVITMLYAAAAFAAADVNKSSAAELEGIKGIGPSLSEKIVEERKSGEFKDWGDFVKRVGGVGGKTAAKFSDEGLTVNGKKFKADAKDAKPAGANADEKASKKKAASPKAAASATK
ncbi:helix-hairpin-helix domain-containing protein [Verminephrobacter aporrectodeae subsp. tuberculatae]|uniref:ComEA family DNA-binding protein n=1 Tax=Verminephrobacter aporrectodeae TaxID=1110389 RepID=UPI0002D5F86B|nr:helix-hairpin-helix domain-containing protein [Verminephrobacter aporrectodeae]MCW5255357.1 helix-hairpin-helix domain-containing protein [Verminephrobacter aporrectodeae subsp. tuberculatae]MCW8164768.1 helix-hairpin-helix domain-containing protein [Verminephrobacter aporrectodeae subsp. tuberculatae]MCW8169562.1 helix-hairpin-helix domain-containing protein [Verminephrobacter aporrectodeae subsp. tuberculatae]MCW8205939.1 helix-hairpin-helix domain-containing protein [Verminephrobacter apo